MLTECFTKPPLNPTFWTQYSLIEIIQIGLGDVLGITIGNSHENGHGNALRIGFVYAF